jgi:hypothetical protein
MNPKEWFRKMIGVMFAGPIILKVRQLSLSMGREAAIKTYGPGITSMAKFSLKFWVPDIASPSEFDRMITKMKSRFWIWKPFFDITVTQDDQDTFKLKVANCPFCEALQQLGYPELAPYVCEGDWKKARENKDKWGFERSCQIGTGGDYCEHTYKRLAASL